MKKPKALFFFGMVGTLLGFYFCNRAALVYETAAGNPIERLIFAIDNLWRTLEETPLLIGTSPPAMKAGIIGGLTVTLFFLYNFFNIKNYMRGKEHGSARWGTPKDIKPLTDPDPDYNIPLSATEKISSRKVKDFESDRNKNVMVIGGSGSGKSFSEVLPSLMQLYGSYVLTDPKCALLPATGYLFLEHGYVVRVFNTMNLTKSLHYNPLAYIHSEKDILKVVNVLIENTSGKGSQAGEKFWVDSERLLYTALIAYLREVGTPEETNIPTMIEMLELCKVKEDDEEYQSPVDIMFEELEKEKPTCLAVKQYKKFKQAAGKTLKSILISCAARLAPFDISEVRELTLYDELQLDTIGEQKTAFFIVMSDTDNTYSFLIAMVMYQMFNLLCEKADNEYNGLLPFSVSCLLDEFANIGKIPNFEHLISTIRSRGISCMPVLQSIGQLTSAYKDDAETIVDNCDTVVFLGGKSQKTTKQISEMIGKTTIDSQNINESRGQTGSYSMNNTILARDLIDPAEIGKLKRSECLVLITGLPPFKSKKYPTEKHKRFKFTSYGGKELFDINVLPEYQKKHFFDNVKRVETVDLSELNSLI